MIQRFQTGLLALTVLSAALTAGCATQYRGYQTTMEGGETGEIVTTATNKELAKKLNIVNPIHRDQDGYMMIQFELQNRQRKQLDFAWAVDWFDQSGFHIDANQRHFKPTSIGGQGSISLQAIAPHKDATSWKLQVTSRDEVK